VVGVLVKLSTGSVACIENMIRHSVQSLNSCNDDANSQQHCTVSRDFPAVNVLANIISETFSRCH
jgi:hypothetical protein